MAQKRILIDKAEVILVVPGKKKVKNYYLVSSDISRIQFDKCTERLFGIIPQKSEKITIASSKLPSWVVYTKGDNKKFFDEYKTELTEFAKKYRVTFTDNTKE